MNANFARLLNNYQDMLIALSAPSLLKDNTPLRPPLAKPATAPLAKSLTLKEIAILARIRNQQQKGGSN
jgi:hypothetical protein